MNKFLSDFKAFAMKGNVVDMAVGIIIGAAFGKIVSSLVADIIMPPIGILVGGVDFTDLAITLKHAVLGEDGKVLEPAVLIKYGSFLQVLLDFIIVSFSVFLLIKGIMALKKQPPPAPVAPPALTLDQQLLTQIKDLLEKQDKNQNN